jgi:nucleoside-diphosphate-sugar epimerase
VNYHDKKIAITGWSGFIGRQVEKALKDEGAEVIRLAGDIREGYTFKELDHTFDYLFHFAAPSSQVLFKRKPAYCIETTLRGAMNAAKTCAKFGIRFIYPSTGLLSSDRYNEYAMCKKIIEDFVRGLGGDALGLRIFATYGPGEGHKADYASVPYLFARELIEGRAPVIFGDGEQVRDFIYIEDVVQAILHAAEECHDPILDIGSGVQTSFNSIIKELNLIVPNPRAATFVEAPGGYVKETAADPTRLHDFYQPRVTFAEGLARMVKSIQEGK